MDKLKEATYVEKNNEKVPKGAEILKKSTTLKVEEIENGFLLTKSSEIKYKQGESTDWMYIDKKYFSKDNPLEVDMEAIEEKTLADKFD